MAEDEFLVYLALEEELRANGFHVVGPFTNVSDVRDAVEHESIDFALLDINLAGEMVYPVADELIARNIPFIFLTGYASAAVPEAYRRFARIEKPYDPAKLMMALRELPANPVPSPS